MDILINHWRPVARRFPSRFHLVTLGQHRKTLESRIETTFDTLNFSFILEGGGSFQWGSQRTEVKAPMLLVQRPGEGVAYGPTEKYGSWQEFFLIYDRNQLPDFISAGLLNPGERVREMGNQEQVRQRIREIVALTHAGVTAEVADRLDRLCELLILESIPAASAEERDPVVRAVQQIHQRVMAHPEDEPDFEDLALKAGLSHSHFRRHWTRLFDAPPRRSLIRQRVNRACELLVNSGLSVAEIAQQSGFTDPLYFSRSFRRETSMTATEYRSRYQPR